MSGRGRGVSNKPAWMTRSDDPGGMDSRGGGGGPPMMDPYHDRGPPSRGFDRGGDRGDRGGPPRDRGFHDRGGPPPPRGGGGYGDRGGGGGRYDDFRGGPPPPRGGDFRDRGRPMSRGRDLDRRDRDFAPGGGGGGRFDHRGGDRRGGPGPGPGPAGPNMPNHKNPGTIFFRSLEEEEAWVMERRRKRLARKSKFDVEPTAEQAAADAAMIALSNPAATDFAGINAADRNFSAVPQQTRHARRLYIGQLPPNVTEDELHVFFRGAIEQAILPGSPGTDASGKLEEDPILSVYINHERRFCFLEFKSVEMTTACMDLDGIDIHGKGKVKVKRPNDYNPSMAPKPTILPKLDISRLGIVSGTVPDGPNKVFVGGLHYHLTDDQVLELLQAFGKVKAFHLVKNDPDSSTSKGYCFAEYLDPSVTQVAVMGLNGMDLGGGKMLTARMAGERTGQVTAGMPDAMPMHASPVITTAAAAAATVATAVAPTVAAAEGILPPHANIVHGYDVEALVDASLGLRPMPTAPMYLDSFGMPLTRLAPTPFVAAPATPLPTSSAVPQQQLQQLPPAIPQPSALDIANAALAAAYGTTAAVAPVAAGAAPSRILVLSNMVTDDDLASDDDYNGLVDEVREECAKFGQLRNLSIPRQAGGPVQPSAIRKIFLEYATAGDAVAASKELAGRKFGDNVVETSFFSETEFAAGRLH